MGFVFFQYIHENCFLCKAEGLHSLWSHKHGYYSMLCRRWGFVNFQAENNLQESFLLFSFVVCHQQMAHTPEYNGNLYFVFNNNIIHTFLWVMFSTILGNWMGQYRLHTSKTFGLPFLSSPLTDLFSSSVFTPNVWSIWCCPYSLSPTLQG